MGVFESGVITKSAVRKTFPDSQQLALLERELRFHPATVETPQALSKKQIEELNQCGYIQGIDVLSDSEPSKTKRWKVTCSPAFGRSFRR